MITTQAMLSKWALRRTEQHGRRVLEDTPRLRLGDGDSLLAVGGIGAPEAKLVEPEPQREPHNFAAEPASHFTAESP
jgi:hypothetical protein